MCLFILIEIMGFFGVPPKVHIAFISQHFSTICAKAHTPVPIWAADTRRPMIPAQASALRDTRLSPQSLAACRQPIHSPPFVPRHAVSIFFAPLPCPFILLLRSPFSHFSPRDSNTCTYPIKQCEGMMRSVQASDTGGVETPTHTTPDPNDNEPAGSQGSLAVEPALPALPEATTHPGHRLDC